MASMMSTAFRRGGTRLQSTLPRMISAPASTRSFTSSAIREYDENQDLDAEDHRARVNPSLYRRRNLPGVFSDVFDPLYPSRNLNHVFNLMDQFMENPLLAAAASARGMSGRRGWDAKEDEKGLYLRIDMPGLSKEHVKVCAEQNSLIICGENDQNDGDQNEEEEEQGRRRYSSRIDLPPEVYKLDQIKAEMKNGVLKVMVPKVTEQERKDVININVE